MRHAARDLHPFVLPRHPISQRWACVLIGVDPKTVRRKRPPDNPELREAMHEIVEKRRRFGYRRVGILLERKGMIMNEKKLYRIYREEGLSVRRRRGRKRARGSRTPMPVPLRPNQRWSLDPRHGHSDQWRSHGSMADTFGACRKFRILAVNDDCCRENLALIADTSISGARVARELDALVRIYGKPACIVSDNGTEFTSKAILKWASANKVEWHYIDPGKPQQNGFIESFNGRAWKATTFNARIEDAREKPAFRQVWRHGRCPVPVGGFYEWSGPRGARQPHFFSPAGNEANLYLAGLASRWRDLLTCTILTREATGAMAGLHHRMPVILNADERDAWLGGADDVAPLGTGVTLACHPVAAFGLQDDGPELIEPLNL